MDEYTAVSAVRQTSRMGMQASQERKAPCRLLLNYSGSMQWYFSLSMQHTNVGKLLFTQNSEAVSHSAVTGAAPPVERWAF